MILFYIPDGASLVIHPAESGDAERFGLGDLLTWIRPLFCTRRSVRAVAQTELS